jgi:hypothetical protein
MTTLRARLGAGRVYKRIVLNRTFMASLGARVYKRIVLNRTFMASLGARRSALKAIEIIDRRGNG